MIRRGITYSRDQVRGVMCHVLLGTKNNPGSGSDTCGIGGIGNRVKCYKGGEKLLINDRIL